MRFSFFKKKITLNLNVNILNKQQNKFFCNKITSITSSSSSTSINKKRMNEIKLKLNNLINKEEIKNKKYQIIYNNLEKQINQINFNNENHKNHENSENNENNNNCNIFQQYNEIQNKLKEYENFQLNIKNLIELLELAESENDVKLYEDCLENFNNLENELQMKKIENVLTLTCDGKSNCFVEIVAGTGGLDAFDWTKMLASMYVKWSSFMNYKASYIEEHIENCSEGTIGYRRVILRIDGEKAYGYMIAESGVHRLVRISPYDPKERRHTSFSQVRIYPVPESETYQSSNQYYIDPKDIRIDTYRSSGNGGQSVNTTDSAVRITHIPTGIIVTCQNERSQSMNKSLAMKVLQAKLYQLDLQNRKEIQEKSKIGVGENTWGNQIRSVILQPYLLVKDHRSGWESSNVDGILNGTKLLKDAMETYLLHYHSILEIKD